MTHTVTEIIINIMTHRNSPLMASIKQILRAQVFYQDNPRDQSCLSAGLWHRVIKKKITILMYQLVADIIKVVLPLPLGTVCHVWLHFSDVRACICAAYRLRLIYKLEEDKVGKLPQAADKEQSGEQR